ncbi:uncharacterized protein LOC130811306 [Amaranthus tricolor]|uniref:uncharacterized protein LOC130811306 n=1 Tax=Amaranthus tricolor TaxID=29722 RepID=UPI002590316B|nr:uncharacterized protein LOC130811306 [Amaranthus tricolor]
MKNKLRIGESTHSTVSLEPTHPIAEPSDAIGNASEEEGDEDEEEVGEDEIQKLEEEVKKMAKKVEEYRSTLPNQLKSSYSSLLSELRPTFSLLDQIDIAEPGTSSGPHSGPVFSNGNSSAEVEANNDEQQNCDKVQLLKDKISSNIAAMPKVIKRMNDCISRIDKLVSSEVTIHPAFKRKKT